MLSLFFKTLRFLLTVCLVLLAGQIPVQGKTVGEHFYVWVRDQFRSTHEKISKSELVASLPKYFGDKKISEPSENDSEKKKSDEGISSMDRESLLRVLQ